MGGSETDEWCEPMGQCCDDDTVGCTGVALPKMLFATLSGFSDQMLGYNQLFAGGVLSQVTAIENKSYRLKKVLTFNPIQSPPIALASEVTVYILADSILAGQDTYYKLHTEAHTTGPAGDYNFVSVNDQTKPYVVLCGASPLVFQTLGQPLLGLVSIPLIGGGIIGYGDWSVPNTYYMLSPTNFGFYVPCDVCPGGVLGPDCVFGGGTPNILWHCPPTEDYSGAACALGVNGLYGWSVPGYGSEGIGATGNGFSCSQNYNPVPNVPPLFSQNITITASGTGAGTQMEVFKQLYVIIACYRDGDGNFVRNDMHVLFETYVGEYRATKQRVDGVNDAFYDDGVVSGAYEATDFTLGEMLRLGLFGYENFYNEFTDPPGIPYISFAATVSYPGGGFVTITP